jgi:hypothetical protein
MKLTSVFAYSRNYYVKAQVAPITLAAIVTQVASPPKQPEFGGGGTCEKEERRALKLYYTQGTNSISVGK